jgi:hypothetical protein
MASPLPGTAFCKSQLGNFATSDVHIIGLDGDHFDFNGEIGKYFAMFSDYNLQVNALFKEWNGTDGSVMAIVGAKIGLHKPTFCTMDMHGVAHVNGQQIRLGEEVHFLTGLPDEVGLARLMDIFTDYDDIKDHNEEYVPTLTGKPLGRGLYIDAGHYVFTLTHNYMDVSNPGSSPYFVNIGYGCRVDYVRPHGVMGQILDFDGQARIAYGKQGEGAIDGVWQDYIVSSLWSHDFTFNKYGIRPKWLNSYKGDYHAIPEQSAASSVLR